MDMEYLDGERQEEVQTEARVLDGLGHWREVFGNCLLPAPGNRAEGDKIFARPTGGGLLPVAGLVVILRRHGALR